MMKGEKEKIYTEGDANFFRLSGYGLAWYILPLPLLGFITCVIMSLIYDFESSTATHCRVHNYLPSISAAIGGFTPQRYIWRICVALHSSPRIMIAVMMYNYYSRMANQVTNPGLYALIVKLTFLIHFAELMALLMLTNVSSTDNHSIHEMSFIMFMLCSLVYMALTCINMRWAHMFTGMSDQVAKCYRYQKNFFGANLFAFLCSCYFYYRHNAYCEPGVYSLFALFEYVIVVTNICFHGSSLFTQWRRARVVIYHPGMHLARHQVTSSYP